MTCRRVLIFWFVRRRPSVYRRYNIYLGIGDGACCDEKTRELRQNTIQKKEDTVRLIVRHGAEKEMVVGSQTID